MSNGNSGAGGPTDERAVRMTGLQKIIAGAIVGIMLSVLGWTASTLLDLRQSMALTQQELRTSVELVRQEVTHLRDEVRRMTGDQYRAADAARDLALRAAVTDELIRRVEALERRAPMRD